MIKNKRWVKPYLYCLGIAFLFLMVCSKNSFLYRINDWVDANAFFTVGKGMVRGVVPYQSLFEQKGPLLYLIYGIGSLISYKSFFGVFLLEVISFSVFLYYTYKIITLFFEAKKAYFVIPIFTLCIVTLGSFSHGGSVEEFSLSLFMISFYHLISYLKDKDVMISRKTVLLTGILAGCILWMKYTLLGFWFGWMMCVFVLQCYNKQYKVAFQNCFIYLFGMLLATIPWMIYFGIHNALGDLWNVYFIVNMNAYSSAGTFIDKIVETFALLFHNLFGSLPTFLGIVIGFFLLFKKGDKWGKAGANATLFTCMLTTGIFIYIGGTSFHYYPFVLTPFILIGFLELLSYTSKQEWNLSNAWCILFSFLALYTICGNTRMVKWSKDDYAQYRFAEIIEKSEDKTLLNYGFLDGGFYTTTGIIPEYYYFMKNNIDYERYPEMMDEQKSYIREKKPHFVVTQKENPVGLPTFSKDYKLIDSHTQRYQTRTMTYFLYERKA